MVWAWELGAAPAAYADIDSTKRGNVFVDGETPTFTFNKTVTGTYVVRNYYGTIVSSGSVNAASLTPTAPGGGWARGWYRLYLTRGSGSDAVYGTSVGATNFSVVADDARFSPRPNRTEDWTPLGEAPNLALKGWLGIGTSRLQIGSASDPVAGSAFDTLANVVNGIAVSHEYWTTGVDHKGPDSSRPRDCYVSFPNLAVDHVVIQNGGVDRLIVAYISGAKAALGNVSVVTAAGTSSGIKLTFTQGATVEVWDNVVGTIAGVLAKQAATPSTLVSLFRADNRPVADTVVSGVNITLTNAKYLGVKSVVQTCYPLGAQWYEGPENEPDIRKNPTRYAHDLFMFKEAAVAGNAGAKVMGPSPVRVSPGPGEDLSAAALDMGAIYRWLTGGVAGDGTGAGPVELVDGPSRAAKNWLDGFMFHPYNFMVTDISSGVYEMENMVRVLNLAGVGHLPRWQGEFGVLTPIYGVYHPRKARWQILQHFMLERYGIPMERNNLWYDEQHGFWNFPGWWMNTDQSLNPHAQLLRVMAEETYGHPYAEALDFGKGVGNKMFLGNVYAGADGTRVIGMAACTHLDNATVVLQLAGTLPTSITWRTGFGVTSTITVDSDGTVELPILGEPTWVRLPAGCTATVKTFLDFNDPSAPNVAGRMAVGLFDGTDVQRIAVNGQWQKTYGNSGQTVSKAAPANYHILLPRKTKVSDVIIFAGMAWQQQSTLVDFDVQTSSDGGGTWTTRATVTKPTPSSIAHATSADSVGCTRETYWDEQWVFPVRFTAVACNAIRLVVRTTSKGGEPNDCDPATQGQGDSVQRVVLTEVYVTSDPPLLYAGG